MHSITIGILKERKENEGRVILTPEVVKILKSNFPNCKILVEDGAGILSGYSNIEYTTVGAIITNYETIWQESDLILKVKEPLMYEIWQAKQNQKILCFVHIPALADYILREVKNKNLELIALERLEKNGTDPLASMSEIAGISAVELISEGLVKTKRMLLKDAKLVVVGSAGIAGFTAVKELLKREVNSLTCIDTKQLNDDKLFEIKPFLKRVIFEWFGPNNLKNCLDSTDAIILAAKINNKNVPTAPIIIGKEEFALIKPKTIIVDIAIDEGGNCIYSKPSPNPYWYQNILIYAIPNLPGAVSKSSTPRLSKAVLPYVIKTIQGIIENNYPVEIKKALITKNTSLLI